MAYLYLALAILAEVTATLSLKACDGFSRPFPSLLVVLGYGVAFFLLSLCLKTFSVAFTYAVWSSLGIVLVASVGAAFYHQPLDRGAVAGIALIIAGVLVMSFYSQNTAH